MVNEEQKVDEILTERMQKYFYNDIARYLKFLQIGAVSLLVLTSATIYFAIQDKTTTLTATTRDRQETLLELKLEPTITSIKLQNLVKKTLIDIYNQDFTSIGSKLPKLKKYFTEDNWNLFEKDFQGFVSSSQNQQFNTRITFLREPVMVNNYEYNGKEYWEFETELLFTYIGSFRDRESRAQIKSERKTFSILFEKGDPRENQRGIVIKRMIVG